MKPFISFDPTQLFRLFKKRVRHPSESYQNCDQSRDCEYGPSWWNIESYATENKRKSKQNVSKSFSHFKPPLANYIIE